MRASPGGHRDLSTMCRGEKKQADDAIYHEDKETEADVRASRILVLALPCTNWMSVTRSLIWPGHPLTFVFDEGIW